MKKKPHNSGQWTEARYRAFFMSTLRKARWPVKYEALKRAAVGKKINPVSGKLATFYRCAKCGGEFPAKEVQSDHINPIVPITGFDSWDGVIKRLAVEIDGFQCLCKTCHAEKTKKENDQRKEARNGNKTI